MIKLVSSYNETFVKVHEENNDGIFALDRLFNGEEVKLLPH